MSTTRQRLVLLLILLLALGLRLHHLDVQSLWYDEGVTARVTQMGIRELTRWTADDIQPPLYYLLLSGWLRIFHPWPGNIAYLMRFFSAGWGLLLVALLFPLARRLWSPCAGLLTAFLAAIAPIMVYYSQEARMYTLVIFLVTLAAFAVVMLLEHSSRQGHPLPEKENQRLGWLALYGITGLAAMYTHYFAAFALLALTLYWAHVWVRENRRLRPLAGFALANAFILLGYLPWLPAMWRRFQIDASYWEGRLKVQEALYHTLANFTLGAREVFRLEDVRAWLPWFGLATALWLVALFLQRRRGAQRPVALVLHWLLLPPILILFLAYRTPKFNPRYLLISWPAWILLAGGGAAALWQPRSWLQGPTWLRRVVQLAAVLTLLLMTTTSALGLDNWFHNPNFAKDAWREAITYMFQHRQPDEVALLVSGHAYPIFDTYLPPDAPPDWRVPRFLLPDMDILDVHQVLGWQESARALNKYLAGYGGVWVFLWQDEVVDPTHVVTTQLDRYAQAQPVPEFAFLGLRHYRLPPEFHIPESPPITQPGSTFPPLGLELVGIEPQEGGLWLYWRALRPSLPDLHAVVAIQQGDDMLLYRDQRPAGYDFPTTRWNQGDIYPLWLPVDQDLHHARLRVGVYDPATGQKAPTFETTLSRK